MTAIATYDMWAALREDDRRFRQILATTLLLALLLGLVVPWLPTWDRVPDKLEEVPRRITGVILEPTEPQPRAAVEPVAPAPPREAETTESPPRATAEAEAPAPADEEPASPTPSARERAADSGVLALRDRVERMRGDGPAASLRAQDLDEPNGARQRSNEHRLTAAEARTGSGGIDDGDIDRHGARVALAGRDVGQVTSSVAAAGGGRADGERDHRSTRTDEEIQLVFDRDKSAIYALYNRALRNDPTLRGQIVVRLTIAPSGEVTAAEMVSSELGDAELEQRLLTRIRQLNFGAKDVDPININYPIDFFPS